MLVLTRKCQQTIQIADNITITILQVKGNTIRVGIEAPRDVRVVRGELPPEAKRGTVVELAVSQQDAEQLVTESTSPGHSPAQGAQDVADSWSTSAKSDMASAGVSQRGTSNVATPAPHRPLADRVSDVTRRRTESLATSSPVRSLAMVSGATGRR